MKNKCSILKILILTMCLGAANLYAAIKLNIHFTKEPKNVYIKYHVIALPSDVASLSSDNHVFHNSFLDSTFNNYHSFKTILFPTHNANIQKQYSIEASLRTENTENIDFTTSDYISNRIGNISMLRVTVSIHKYYSHFSITSNRSPIDEKTIEFINPESNIYINANITKAKEIVLTKYSAYDSCVVL